MAVKRKTKQEKAAEKASDDAFRKLGNCISFDVFDLSKIHAAGVDAFLAGQDVEAAVQAAITQYRKD